MAKPMKEGGIPRDLEPNTIPVVCELLFWNAKKEKMKPVSSSYLLTMILG